MVAAGAASAQRLLRRRYLRRAETFRPATVPCPPTVAAVVAATDALIVAGQEIRVVVSRGVL